MVTLRYFTDADVSLLREKRYVDMRPCEVEEMLRKWNEKQVNGRDFEMFAVCDGENVVGMISLYRQTADTVSVGPEIFHDCRRRGYGTLAMRAAMDAAIDRGYKIAFAQIRTDNAASIALHEALGFASNGQVFTNARGNPVVFYLRSLI